MKTIAVIPSRYASTRLPAKPLADIHGRPMIQWVYESVKEMEFADEVIVATDDNRIQEVAEGFGAKVVMTSLDHQSGTDRVAEVARGIDCDIVINIQGDEPMLRARDVGGAHELVASGRFEMATIATEFQSREDYLKLSCVKVLVDRSDRAIYFSRLPIPYGRAPVEPLEGRFLARMHIGVYVYRKDLLLRLAGLAPVPLEAAESLEQLRALDYGIPIGIAECKYHGIAVDTAEDLDLVRQHLV